VQEVAGNIMGEGGEKVVIAEYYMLRTVKVQVIHGYVAGGMVYTEGDTAPWYRVTCCRQEGRHINRKVLCR
jgi:hypothetical protein